MTKVKVKLEREECVSCQACVIADDQDFVMDDDDMKSNLIDGETTDGVMEKDVEADDARKEKLKAAEAGCPVTIIHVTE